MGNRQLVIDRTKWLRGKGSGVSGLLKNGFMCCLGFDALACGYELTNLEGRQMPASLHNSKLKMPHCVTDGPSSPADSEFAANAAGINDDIFINDTYREARLVKLFLEQGIELSFIN